jgi:HK97 family phage major capsid protein
MSATAELDDLIKSVKDATDAIKGAQSDMEKSVEEKVEQTLKKILRNHPGLTPERTIKFEGTGETETDALIKDLPKEVHYEMDKVYLLSKILRVHPKQLKSYTGFRRIFEAKASEFQKALDSTTAGGVDEWVPTEMSPSLKEKVRLQLKVAGLFTTVPMPSNPYELPIEVGNYNTFSVPENTADTGQTAIPVGDDASVSGKVTFSAKGHKTRVLMSKEATEDSIVPLMPQVQAGIALGLAQGREDMILNGDTAGSHEDTDVSAATDRRKAVLGLRALANDNAYTADLATLSLSNLLDARENMGVYGVNPGDLALVTSIKGYIKLMKVDEFLTIDKMGPNAVVLAGQLGSAAGSPVIISEYVRSVLNASGIYESGQTRTAIYIVNRNAFAIGERSRPTAELLTEFYAIYGQNALLITERVDFQPFFPIATNQAITLGVNVG